MGERARLAGLLRNDNGTPDMRGGGEATLSVSSHIKAKVMTTFDERKESFEKRFALDEELRFKATARRNKQLGLWAANKLGLKGAEADSYALSVVMSVFEDNAGHGNGTQDP
jgi:hypothetical protein